MPNLGFPELILILIIALVIFGPGKLPSIGSSLGKAFKEFKKATKEIANEDKSSENAFEATGNESSKKGE